MHFSPRGLSVKEGEVVNGLDSEDTHVAIGVVFGIRRRCGLCSLVGQTVLGVGVTAAADFWHGQSKARHSATKTAAKAQQAAQQMASRDKT